MPSSPTLHQIDINEAGISSQQAYINILDINGEGKGKPVLCDIEISVPLDNDRGIHMSRCEEALFELAEMTHDSIDSFSTSLARLIRDRQKSKGSIVRVSGIYLHDHLTKKTKQISHDKIYLLSEVRIDEDEERIKTGLRAFNINACPCTRAYTKYSVIPDLKAAGFDYEQIKKILDIVVTGSHTQRGTISILIDKTSPEITSGELYEAIDRSSHLVYELLKRPDEHELVVRALNNPQFTEDVVREVTMSTYNRFGSIAPAETSVQVESVLQDSIHIHDVRARISTTFGQIRKTLLNESC